MTESLVRQVYFVDFRPGGLPDGRKKNLLPHFTHEDVELKTKRLLVEAAILDAHRKVEGRRHRRQKLGAGVVEGRLELGQVAGGHLVHLLGVVLLLQHGVQRLIDSLRMQDEADGQQRVHLVSTL
jgi:hypothetical protein